MERVRPCGAPWFRRARAAIAFGAAALGFVALAGYPARAEPPGSVILNEIHYDPPEKTRAEEFVELHNPGGGAIDLSGWFLSDGIRYRFPEGASIAPGGFLVVAEDPEDFEAKFGFPPDYGPYDGRLSNDGERVCLRDRRGDLIDEVSWGVGFPWPVACAGRGSSLERIHPNLDPDLGGSWRASGYSEEPPVQPVVFIAPRSDGWRYRKGTSEASSPADAWRGVDFLLDGSWLSGTAGFGYGDDDDTTVLSDMQGSYSSVYLRREFTVEDPAQVPSGLKLRLYVDDGCVAWLNGVEVARLYVAAGELAYNALAQNHEAAWEEVPIPNPAAALRPGKNVLAIHALNQSLTSSDFSIDAALLVPGGEERTFGEPTPRARNSVFSENAPPQIHEVAHLPEQPIAGSPFLLTAKVTDPDGVARVLVSYQVVAPGAYVPAYLAHPQAVLLSDPTRPLERNPAFDDPANWRELALRDDGLAGDEIAGDGVFTGILPAQENRTLVRYRISAEDPLGRSVTVPYADDDSLNFACFVYDGVPPYRVETRTVQPGGPPYVYSRELMNSLPVYFLITRNEDLMHCYAYDGAYQIPKGNEAARDAFNWEGAFVYEGIVYDHVRYRLRQANDRYGGAGKRAMRVRFHKGYYLRAKDRYGRPYPTPWRTLNIGKMFDNKRVGNFGLTETLNSILWNAVGVPAPHFHTFHFRVVDGPEEAPSGPNGQYYGDFWGMFTAVEDYDSHFIEAHGLPDGNLYKLKDGIYDGKRLQRHQGRFAVTNAEDFDNIHYNLRPERPDSWLETYVAYDRWYPYHAICEAVRHYDFVPADSHLKNRAWFFEPDPRSPYGRLWTLPHDSDASWGPSWNDGVDYSKNAIFAAPGKPAFKVRYRNAIREVRDLLWTEEVIPEMIDDLAEEVRAFSEADRDRWRAAPADAGSQDFGPIETKVQDMKNFAFVGWSGSTGPTVPAGGRARHLDDLAGAEGDGAAIPRTPSVTSLSPAGFPLDRLSFEASPFSDPQGDETFAAMAWRVGEVTDLWAPGYDPAAPRVYEHAAVWESGEIPEFQPVVTIPPVLRVGHTYRIRVRMKDATERWSHWSAPCEFTVGPPSRPYPEQSYLRVTEIMYHPPAGSDLEFIELKNIGPVALDLRFVELRDAIEFRFSEGGVTSLAPGELVVVVQDRMVFEAAYDASGIRIAGEYSGRLGNAGERLLLVFGGNLTILECVYDDRLSGADGLGHSLVIEDPFAEPEAWSDPANWRESSEPGGSPGRDDGGPGPSGGWQRPGDGNQDGALDISDGVSLLFSLFGGGRPSLPCDGGRIDSAGNVRLLDSDGNGRVELTDALYVLSHLFRSGPAPALGSSCVRIEGCPDACGR